MTKQSLSEKLGQSVFAEKLRLALQKYKERLEKQQLEKANDNKDRSQTSK